MDQLEIYEKHKKKIHIIWEIEEIASNRPKTVKTYQNYMRKINKLCYMLENEIRGL